MKCPPIFPPRTNDGKQKTAKIMKTKMILTTVLGMTFGMAILWLAPFDSNAADTASASQKVLYYACPMHPSVKEKKPGDCPICGMKLVPAYESGSATGTNAPAAAKTKAMAVKADSTALPTGCGGSCPIKSEP